MGRPPTNFFVLGSIEKLCESGDGLGEAETPSRLRRGASHRRLPILEESENLFHCGRERLLPSDQA